MRISQLEYIIAIEKYGSINMAANQLFVSQSQVSAAVKSLEEELGKDLFIRSSKGIRLTVFGTEFMPYAKFVVSQVEQMKNLGKQVSQTYSLTVCSNGFRFPFRLASQFYGSHSQRLSNINIRHVSRQDMIDMLSNHTADIGITQIWSFQASSINKQLQGKDVVFYPCVVKPLAVVVGPDNPLYRYPKNSILPGMLNEYPYLVPDYSLFSPGSKQLDQIPGFYPKKLISTTDLGDSLEVLHNCSAFTIVADSGTQGHSLGEYPGCRTLELEGCKFYSQVGWMKNKRTELSPMAQEYADIIADYLQER